MLASSSNLSSSAPASRPPHNNFHHLHLSHRAVSTISPASPRMDPLIPVTLMVPNLPSDHRAHHCRMGQTFLLIPQWSSNQISGVMPKSPTMHLLNDSSCNPTFSNTFSLPTNISHHNSLILPNKAPVTSLGYTTNNVSRAIPWPSCNLFSTLITMASVEASCDSGVSHV